MKRLIAVAMLALLATPVLAKKKEEPAPAAPRRNYMDLRGAQIFCTKDGCALDISQSGIIACNVDGCRQLTDVVVSVGPVNRAQPQPVVPPPPPVTKKP